ncbi:hypothetical protein ABIE30_000964 [Janthinobacterium lividum]
MNRASARSSFSIVPSCSASTRQAFFITSNSISISQRARYQSIKATASSSLTTVRFVSKLHARRHLEGDFTHRQSLGRLRPELVAFGQAAVVLGAHQPVGRRAQLLGPGHQQHQIGHLQYDACRQARVPSRQYARSPRSSASFPSGRRAGLTHYSTCEPTSTRSARPAERARASRCRLDAFTCRAGPNSSAVPALGSPGR